jgi:ankyrin repeat protein
MTDGDERARTDNSSGIGNRDCGDDDDDDAVAAASELLRAGADANAAGDGGWTLAMAAAWAGRPALLRPLLEARANPNAVNAVRDMVGLTRWRSV